MGRVDSQAEWLDSKEEWTMRVAGQRSGHCAGVYIICRGYVRVNSMEEWRAWRTI
jgi:hypothetical protein